MAKKPQRTAPASAGDGMAVYQVGDERLTVISHGSESYPVEKGQVRLPPGAAWVQALVNDGMVRKGAAAPTQLTLKEDLSDEKGKK